MAWTSTVPDAIAALVAAFQTSADLDGVDVRDGPTLGNQAAMEVVYVGRSGDEEGTAAENQTAIEGAAASRDREQFTVHCAAAVLSGAGKVPDARARAYELLDACADAVARDRTLGRVVIKAWVSQASLRQQQGDSGLTATVLFSVDCDAYSGR